MVFTRKCEQKTCVGESTKSRKCRRKPCPVRPYKWTMWVKGTCSATCGKGTLTFTRTCLEGTCVGESTRTESCEEKVCPVWSEWWKGRCSVTCGNGTQISRRYCLKGTCVGKGVHKEICVKDKCSLWGDWVKGDCSTTCGKGTLNYTRSCLQETPCIGRSTRPESCEHKYCSGEVLGRGRSCKEIKDSDPSAVTGIYEVDVRGEQIELVCDMDIAGGGWTVFQYRYHGKTDFSRKWNTYESGFGHLDSEFWLGLKNINKLTSEGTFDLRVQMTAFDGRIRYAQYKSFKVANASDNYRLSFKNNSNSGNAGDSLFPNNNMQFSTKDVDNDNWKGGNCVNRFSGGGNWNNYCNRQNFNGAYGGRGRYGTSYMQWHNFRGSPNNNLLVNRVDRYESLEKMRWMFREA